MNTRKLTLAVSVFLTIAFLTTVTAQAFSISDLFKSASAKDQDTGSASFDSLNALVMASSQTQDEKIVMNETTMSAATSPVGGNGVVLRRTYTVTVSGYNSEVGQTDASPFITANGTHVRDGIVAANIYDSYGRNMPFNTAFKFKNCGGIPEDKIFIVTDRLNARYRNNVDIWFADHGVAVKFGRRNCQIEVIQ